MKKLKRNINSEYTKSLLFITKLFVNDELTVDDYKSALQLLCSNYRKDLKENGYKTSSV